MLQCCCCIVPCPAHNTCSGSCRPQRRGLSRLHTIVPFFPAGELLANELVCGRAQLSLRHGGLGLRSAAQHAPAAYFASWADALQAISLRDPELAATAARRLQRPHEAAPSLAALQEAARTLAGAGFQAPRVDQLAHTPSPLPEQPDDQPTDTTRGGQRSASFALDAVFAASLTSRLDPPSTALLDSQSGPFAAKVLTALPTSPELRLEPASYHVVLLRRLRLQLPLVPAFCPCRRRLDALGDHRASCPRSGLLRSRAVPLERAAARVFEYISLFGRVLGSAESPRRLEFLELACNMAASDSESNMSGVDVTITAVHPSPFRDPTTGDEFDGQEIPESRDIQAFLD
eukprot:s4698_g5.t1